MKNLHPIIILILLSSLFLLGCKKPTEETYKDVIEIKLSDLKTPCDYIDALDECVSLSLFILREKEVYSINDEEKVLIKGLEKKRKEIDYAAGNKYTKAEFEECGEKAQVFLKKKQYYMKKYNANWTDLILH